MAHKKGLGSSKNGRDSKPKYLGVKRFDGEQVTAGSIIVRQRGMTFIAGSGAGLGHDYTVFATVSGHVKFDHASKAKKRIRVLPLEIATDGHGSPAARPAASGTESAGGTATTTATATKPRTRTTTDTAAAATPKTTTARCSTSGSLPLPTSQPRRLGRARPRRLARRRHHLRTMPTVLCCGAASRNRSHKRWRRGQRPPAR